VETTVTSHHIGINDGRKLKTKGWMTSLGMVFIPSLMSLSIGSKLITGDTDIHKCAHANKN
jgi:hypothetical protein